MQQLHSILDTRISYSQFLAPLLDDLHCWPSHSVHAREAILQFSSPGVASTLYYHILDGPFFNNIDQPGGQYTPDTARSFLPFYHYLEQVLSW